MTDIREDGNVILVDFQGQFALDIAASTEVLFNDADAALIRIRVEMGGKPLFTKHILLTADDEA